MNSAVCPECDQLIVFTSSPKLRERVICTRCGSALKVIQLSPLILDWAFLEPFEGSVHGIDGRHTTGMT
jgi:lysine biosynthesis protein LysW